MAVIQNTVRTIYDTPGSARSINQIALVNRGLEASNDNVKRLGFSLKSLGGISGIAKNVALGVAGLATAGVAAGAGILALAKRSISAADDIAKFADSIAVSSRFLQEQRFALGQSGVSVEQSDRLFRKFSQTLEETARGQGGAVEQLRRLDSGLLSNLRNARSVEEAYRLTLKTLSRTNDAVRRNAIAFAVLGKAGRNLAAAVSDGTTNFDTLARSAGGLGLVLEDRLLRQAEKAGDALDLIQSVIGTQLNKVILQLTPLIIRLSQNFGLLAPKIQTATDKIAGFFGIFEAVSQTGLEKLISEQEKRVQKLQFGLIEALERIQKLPQEQQSEAAQRAIGPLDAARKKLEELQTALKRVQETDAATENLLGNLDTTKQSETLKNLQLTVSNLEKQAIASAKSEEALQRELATQQALNIVRKEAEKGINLSVKQVETLITKQQQLTKILQDQKQARQDATREAEQAQKQAESISKRLDNNIRAEREFGATEIEIINQRKQALLDEVQALKINASERERLNDKIQTLTNKRIENSKRAALEEKLAFSSTNQAIEDELVSLVRNGEINIQSLVDTIINEFLRLVVIRPLLESFSNSFSGGFTSILSTFLGSASGGLVKKAASGGPVHMQSGGMVRDRVPAFLEPGEFVVRKQAVQSVGLPTLQGINRGKSNLPNIKVEFKNEGTPQEQSGDPDFRFDGESLIIDVVTKDLRNNGQIRRSLKGLRG